MGTKSANSGQRCKIAPITLTFEAIDLETINLAVGKISDFSAFGIPTQPKGYRS
jgi:hypothetical protein